jgi:hypothetical protein
MMRKLRWGAYSLPDHRDIWKSKFSIPITQHPPKASVESRMPRIWDQGNLGSCTAFSTLALWACEIQYSGYKLYDDPAWMAIYWAGRKLEDCEFYDSGCVLRDPIKVVANGDASLGVPPNSKWKYNDSDPGPFTQRPPDEVWVTGINVRLKNYYRIDSIDELRDEISTGHGVAFAFSVPATFDYNTKELITPSYETRIVGGHAVFAVAYDDTREMIKVRNSWGPKANDGTGHFEMSYRMWEDSSWMMEAWAARAV